MQSRGTGSQFSLCTCTVMALNHSSISRAITCQRCNRKLFLMNLSWQSIALVSECRVIKSPNLTVTCLHRLLDPHRYRGAGTSAAMKCKDIVAWRLPRAECRQSVYDRIMRWCECLGVISVCWRSIHAAWQNPSGRLW